MKPASWLIRLFTPLVWLIFPFRSVGLRAALAEAEGRPLILCCNHTHLIDPVLLLMAFPRHIFFMAKAELFQGRAARWFLGKAMGAFPVARGTGDSAALETAQKIVRSGKVMGIFPEGTRSKNGELGRFKSGAAWIAYQTGAMLLPVRLVNRHKKVTPFSMTTIHFGHPMTVEEPGLTGGDKSNIRKATRRLMEEIEKL